MGFEKVENEKNTIISSKHLISESVHTDITLQQKLNLENKPAVF